MPKDNPVTKKDLQKLATQAGLKIVEKSLRTEILKVEERAEGLEESVENVESRLERVEYKVERVEAKVDKIDRKLDKIAETLDGFVGVVDNLRTDNSIATEQYRDHEKRISKLESKVQAA